MNLFQVAYKNLWGKKIRSGRTDRKFGFRAQPRDYEYIEPPAS
jgi:hypothetical protein